MDTDLLSRVLREARDAAPNPAAAMAIEDLTHDLDNVIDLDPEQQAPEGLLDAVQALYLVCGDEDSEEAEAVASLPPDLNEALADVIRYGVDL